MEDIKKKIKKSTHHAVKIKIKEEKLDEDFSNLSERQTEINDKINQMFKKFKSLPKKKQTKKYLEEEIKNLDVLWLEFKGNHQTLNQADSNSNYDTELMEEVLVLKDVFSSEIKKSLKGLEVIRDSILVDDETSLTSLSQDISKFVPETSLLVEIHQNSPLNHKNLSKTAEKQLEIFVADNGNTCRICSTKNAEGLTPLIEVIGKLGKTVLELIVFCIGVQIADNDSFPQNVCKYCVEKLEESYTLKTTCLQSDENLKIEYKSILEMEDPETEFLVEEMDYTAEVDQEAEEDQDDSDFQLMDASMLQEIKDAKGHSNLKAGIGFESTCYVCNGNFKSMEKVFLHYLRKHRKKGVFVCDHPKCNGKEILSSKTFHFHLQAHYNPSKIKCKLCLKKFYDEWSFRKHTYKHTSNNLLECEHCGEKVWFKANLDKHIREVHLKIEKTPKKDKTESRPNRIATACYVCNENFDSMEKVFLHLKNTHSSKKGGIFNCHQSGCRGRKFIVAKSFHFHLKSHFEPQSLKCPECQRIFNDEWLFSKHKYRHSEKFEMRRMEKEQLRQSRIKDLPPKKVKISRKIPGTCFLCKGNFDSMEKLFAHIKAEHIKNGFFRCYQQQCYGKKFGGPRSFHFHLEAHFRPSIFTCKLCNRVFKTEWAWKCHKYRHMKVKIICDLCGKQLSSKHIFIKHLERIHKRNGKIVNKGYYLDKEKALIHSAIPKGIPCSCYVCNFQFDSHMKLYSHIQQNHAIQGTFHCTFENCKNKFMSSSSFHFHLEGHYNPKAFSCHMCDRVFKERVSFMNHIYNHKFRVEGICDYCGVKIWYKRNLLKHMVKVHKIGKMDKRKRAKKKAVKKKKRSAANVSSIQDFQIREYEMDDYEAEEMPEEYDDWHASLLPNAPIHEEPPVEFKQESEEIFSIVQIKEEKH